MSNPLKWGVIGTGNIAGKFAGQLPQTDRAEMVACGSRSQESADRFAIEYGGVGHASYQAMLDDDNVEAVYISLPNSMHHEWTIKAVEAGKHVLCEKPFASNVAEAKEMFAAGKEAGLSVIEAFMYRTQPVIHKVIEMVRGGAVGEVRIIRSNFTFNRPASMDDCRYQPELAGGSIMDVGTYCTNFTRALVGGEPTEVSAICHKHAGGVDEYAAGTMRFAGDILTTFTCGMTVNSDWGTFIGGTKGHLHIDAPWFSEGKFTVTEGNEESTEHEVKSPMDLYAMEAAAFAEAAQDGAAPWLTEADTLGNMAVLDQLRASAGLGY
jgi:predicted dehydrogenase